MCTFSNCRETRNVTPANCGVLRPVQVFMPYCFKIPTLALPKPKLENLIFNAPKLPEIRAMSQVTKVQYLKKNFFIFFKHFLCIYSCIRIIAIIYSITMSKEQSC